MSRGKHAKPISYNVKPKFKKSLLFILLSLFVLCIIFDFLAPATDTQSIASENEIQNTTTKNKTEVTTQTTTKPEKVEEVKKIESMEDENIKTLIEYEISKYGFNKNNFAFFYYNVNDKKYYFYNEDAYFTAASTIKVPVSMYYYDEINLGNYTENSELLYTDDCYEAGGGTTASFYSAGDKVPLNFLLEQAIVNSDNTAVNILIKNLGYSNAKRKITKYSDEPVPDSFYSSNIISAGFVYDVINYLYEHQEKYQKLISDMKKSSMGKYLKEYITDYEIAHKYGSYSGYVHDYGIVYTNTPYLIGVFTKNITNADKVIAQISLDVFNYTQGILDVTFLQSTNNTTNTAQ